MDFGRTCYGTVANLLQTCYGQTDVIHFGLYTASVNYHVTSQTHSQNNQQILYSRHHRRWFRVFALSQYLTSTFYIIIHHNRQVIYYFLANKKSK